MNENEYLAKIIKKKLEADSPIVLISIVSLQGSTPRHSGTKMVVGADGTCSCADSSPSGHGGLPIGGH